MKIRAEDQPKAAVLVLLIIAVGFFALRPILFRSKPAPAPVAATNMPPPVDPIGTTPLEPDIRVDQLDSGVGGVAPPINPFRKTVDLQPASSSDQSSSAPSKADAVIGNSRKPTGLTGNLGTGGSSPLPPVIPEALEFRLDGVLVNGGSIAIVRRGGQTHHLRVGSPAAYGYKIAQIMPIGIRVVLKNDSRLIRVGETFRYPETDVR